MPEVKPSPEEMQAIEKLAKDVHTDRKLGQRLMTDTNVVLKEYKLDGLMKRLGNPLHLDLRMLPRKPPVPDIFGLHVDLEGGHNDSQGHTDGPGWHFDI